MIPSPVSGCQELFSIIMIIRIWQPPYITYRIGNITYIIGSANPYSIRLDTVLSVSIQWVVLGASI
jgi:hypothetical protein